MARPYEVSAERIVEAVQEIQSCLGQEEVARRTLDILANVFRFDYLLFTVRIQRGNEYWYEGRYCGGGAPKGLVEATKRRCQPIEDAAEDILCFVSRQRKIFRVDPLAADSPLAKKLHQPTVAEFRYTNPIYFIPLEDKSGQVQAIIHASLPRERDPGERDARFMRHLKMLAISAGLAIANAELHYGLDQLVKQREALLALRAKLDSLPTLDQKYHLILTVLTSGIGFRYNRGLLFLADLNGNFVGVSGIAPKNEQHFIEVGKVVKDWGVDQFISNFESNPTENAWLVKELKEVTLSLTSGYPIHDAFAKGCVQVVPNNTIPDPSFHKLKHVFAVSSSYVIIPLLFDTTCLGFLYLDNTFTKEPMDDIGSLSLLGERLASIINMAWVGWYRQQSTRAFMQLIIRSESLIADPDFKPYMLHESLIEASSLVGSRRSCIVSRSKGKDWVVARSTSNWARDDPTGKQVLQRLGRDVTPEGLVSIWRGNPDKKHASVIMSVVLPFSFGDIEYAICIEPYARLADQPEITEAVATLAAFGSAVLAAAERSHLLTTDARFFAQNLMRITAHESRNVLNDLLWALDNFKATNPKLSNRAARQFEVLQRRVDAGIDALASYLDLIKEGDTESDRKIGWTSLSQVVHHVANVIKPRIMGEGASFENVFHFGDLSFEVKMNRTNLTIVIYNLISNAVKAIRGISSPSIQVSAEPDLDRSWIRIKVSDNGCGITTDQKDKLFIPGFSGFAERDAREGRSSGLTSRNSGIGLHSVKAIVEQDHGGKIRLNSVGGRTEAVVNLPGRLLSKQ